MKKYLVIALLLSFFSFQFSSANGQSSNRKSSNRQSVVLSCDIHCQGCCDKIMKNIAFERGVRDIVCDLPSRTVTVTYDAAKTDLPTLLKAFERIGKPARVKDAPPAPQTVPADTAADASADAPTDAATGASTPD